MCACMMVCLLQNLAYDADNTSVAVWTMSDIEKQQQVKEKRMERDRVLNTTHYLWPLLSSLMRTPTVRSVSQTDRQHEITNARIKRVAVFSIEHHRRCRSYHYARARLFNVCMTRLPPHASRRWLISSSSSRRALSPFQWVIFRQQKHVWQ